VTDRRHREQMNIMAFQVALGIWVLTCGTPRPIVWERWPLVVIPGAAFGARGTRDRAVDGGAGQHLSRTDERVRAVPRSRSHRAQALYGRILGAGGARVSGGSARDLGCGWPDQYAVPALRRGDHPAGVGSAPRSG